jgi:hypothetical protein
MGWDGDEMGQAAEEGIIGLYGMGRHKSTRRFLDPGYKHRHTVTSFSTLYFPFFLFDPSIEIPDRYIILLIHVSIYYTNKDI